MNAKEQKAMRINFNPGQVADIYFKRLKTTGEEGKKESVAGSHLQKDAVEISDRARELQLYRAHLKELPETREELVAAVKKRLAEGTYRIDAEKVAAGIIEEHRLDRRV